MPMTDDLAKQIAQMVYSNLEDDNLIDAMKKVDSQIVFLAISSASRSMAARYLGINRTTLIEKFNRYTRGQGWRRKLAEERQATDGGIKTGPDSL